MPSSQAQTGPVVAPSITAPPAAAATRTQHVPARQHPQYQYQQRNPTGGVPMGQQHAHLQVQQQQQQQQRPNPADVRAPQYTSQPVTVVSNNGTNPPSNYPQQPQQQQQQQQQLQTQHFRQPNPQQRHAQHSQQKTLSQQHPQQPTYTTQTQVPNPNRSVPTPPSQSSLSSNPVPTTAPNSHTPLYERLVTEEAKELKEYVRLIEQQSRRISDLEKIHLDLERRLESQTAQRQRLEYTLQQRERYWKATTDKLNGERTTMENTIKEEKIKVEKLLDMVNRLQNEIQSMIKNKFNSSRGTEAQLHGSVNSSNSGSVIKKVTSAQAVERARSGSGASGSRSDSQHLQNIGGGGKNVNKRHIGPHELLACNGSAEAVRERNALTSLMDFFGM